MIETPWASVVLSGQVDAQSLFFSAAAVVAAPWLAGRATRWRSLRAAALEREHEQRERLAVSEERARIARELHDIVAHSVGVMVVQALGARRVLEREPDRAREALGSIEQTGRTALTEMRRSLGLLRREGAEAALAPQPGLDGDEDRVFRVQLELHLGREPITGCLRPEQGAEEPFVGWLGFVDALKRLNERKEQQ